jgi:hypothetical protein
MAFTFSFTTTKEVADFLATRSDKSQLITQLLEDFMNRDQNAVSEEEQLALEDIVATGKTKDWKLWCNLCENVGVKASAREFMDMAKNAELRKRRFGEILSMPRQNNDKTEKINNDNTPDTPTTSEPLHPL